VAQLNPKTLPACLLLAVVSLASPRAGAREEVDPGAGLATGKAHEVLLTAFPTEGLEVGMPRTGWYAKGIEYDIKGNWRASADAYRKAMKAFKQVRDQRPGWEAVVDGWVLKARFQRDQSSQLARAIKYPSRYSFSRSRYNLALAMHHKWLAIRAFTGRSDTALKQKIIDEYTRAVLGSRRSARERLSLATFYQQAGLFQRAARERAKIKSHRRRYLNLEEASYQAAAGDMALAFAALEKAARSSNSRFIARASNMLDPLRADPRFSRLVERKR
jgi:hypothetical protein